MVPLSLFLARVERPFSSLILRGIPAGLSRFTTAGGGALRLAVGLILAAVHGATADSAAPAPLQQHTWDLPEGPTAVSPQAAGTPAFAHFSPELFGGAHNFDGVAQTIDGRVFVIAEHVLMVGTGVRWRPVEGLPEQPARHLHLSRDGRLYVSLDADFGYFKLDEALQPPWHSISDHLPSDWVRGAEWKPLYEDAEGHVYFVGGRHVFAHHPERPLLLWKDVGWVEHIFTLKGVVHVMTAAREVYSLGRHGSFEIVARDLPPTYADIRASVAYSADRHLFACGAAGLATYDGKRFTPLPLQGIEDAQFVPDQLLRVGPELYVAVDYAHGLLVFRSDGTVLRQVHQVGDLKARIAQAVTIDRDGWIWLAHASGLYRINAASPQTSFNYNHGLEGRVLCMTEHEGRFYVGTDDGLFAWSQPRPEVAGRFEPVPSVPAAHSLVSTAQGLAVGTRRGLWILDGRGPYLVHSGDFPLILESPLASETLLAPNLEGVRQFEYRGQRWTAATNAPHLPTTGLAAVIDTEGALWAEYGPGRVARFGFNPRETQPTVFTPENGLPLFTVEPFVVGPEMVFRAGGSLYRYLPERNLFTRSEAWRVRPHTIGQTPGALAVESPEGDVWIAPSSLGREFLRFPPEGFAYAWPDIARFGHDPLTAVYRDTIGYLWIGNGRGLLRFRPDPAPPRRAFPRQTLVHAVISDRYERPLAMIPGGVIHLALGAFPKAQPLLRFEFSLLDYEHLGGTTYTTFLEGFDSDWQPFQTEASREVTALPPGDYMLHIKGRNRYGEEGDPATIRFTLPLSPWKTWWARVLYGLGVVAFFALLLFLRQRQLLSAQNRLSKQLADRDRQIGELDGELATHRAQLQTATAEVETLSGENESLRRQRAHSMADLSHALRPAITSITHLSRLLGRAVVERPASRLVEGLRQAGEHLVGAAREFLDLRQLEVDHLALENRSFDLREPLEESLASVAPAALAKGLELNYAIEPGLRLRREGDPVRVKQVLCHLAANAIAHTTTGDVTLSVRKMQGKSTDFVEFVVVDHGPGLDREQQAKILAASDPHKLPRYRGAPQGLAIARHLLQALGGDLSIESTPEEGARVHFHLNLPPAPEPPEGRAQPLAQKLVLIVEDNPTTLKCLQQLAEERGLFTRLAYDPPQALEALKEQPAPDLLWLDHQLENGSSEALLEAIRGQEAFARLPVVLLAPEADDPAVQALAAEAHTIVLRKPFHHGPLLAASLGLVAPPRDTLPGATTSHEDEPVEIEESTPAEDDPMEARIRAALAKASGKTPEGAEPTEADHRSPLRILLLDAHPARPFATRELFRRVGYEAHLVKDSTDAIAALEEADHDLVFLAEPLPAPGLAGAVELIRRNLPPGADPLFVALSSQPDLPIKQIGVQEQLRPPLNPEELARFLRLVARPTS
jgi:signal transduction histidine kinase/CheY-like chemotaxis protein/ligand-binding sensor domain-containing protein